VICALAPAAVPKQSAIIDAAVEAGVSRFIPSEFGFDISNPFNAKQPGYKAKIAIEKHVQEKASQHPSFSYTLISNGHLSGSHHTNEQGRLQTSFLMSRLLCMKSTHKSILSTSSVTEMLQSRSPAMKSKIY
jgi:hypothetical protein